MSSLYKRYNEFGIHQLSVGNNGLIIIFKWKRPGADPRGVKRVNLIDAPSESHQGSRQKNDV